MNQRPKTVRIGLLWHSMNSDNLGVGALTLANIAILEEAAKTAGLIPQFVILGWTDPKPPYLERPDIDVIGLRMKDFVKPRGGLYSHFRKCDIVFDIGAGDSFTDIYGAKRFATILGSKLITLAARRPLFLSPQTIGPFNRPWRRRAALAVMNHARAVTSRDDLSTTFLQNMGYRKEIIEASDVALRLPYEPRKSGRKDVVKIGLNVSGLLYSGGYNRDNMFGLQSSYKDLIRELLGRLCGQKGYEIHLVAHVISDTQEVEDDYRANQKLAKDFPSVILAPKFHTPIEAKSYISGMDFFAGARMHACIAAFSTGVPVLPMAYSRKFAGLFGSMGYDVLADCQTESADEILAHFEQALADRDQLRTQMAPCLERGLARLKTYELSAAAALTAATK